MSPQTDSLNRVLRCELTAVDQQFVHWLVLRAWGDEETAARIMQVDAIDFPNAMRIIDYLVETDAPIALDPDHFTPGTDRRSMLASEQVVEQRLVAALESAECTDDRARALISAAQAPREAYAAWLADRLRGSGGAEPAADRPFPEIAGVFAHLIAMLEQAMVCAFVHWHRGEASHADGAWATSGAAMMHATKMVRLLARHKAVPVPGPIPELRIAGEPAAALDADRALAARCATEAEAAASTCADAALADLCRGIAADAAQLSAWNPKDRHPASHRNPPAFSSFEATLTKHVWSRESAA